MNNEKWCKIKDFPNYAVSNRGRVMRLTRGSKTRPGKILKNKDNRRGYWCVTLRRENKSYTKCIHTLVLETFIGSRLEGKVCRHLDGDRKNNNVSNVCWGTYSENQKDRHTHGTASYGKNNPMCKLTKEMVEEIRCDPRSSKKVAKDYNISDGHVRRLRRYELRNFG